MIDAPTAEQFRNDCSKAWSPVALEARNRSGMVETLLFSPRARRIVSAQRSEASELIDFLGLGRYADRPISELSTGTRRVVELGGLIAVGPAL